MGVIDGDASALAQESNKCTVHAGGFVSNKRSGEFVALQTDGALFNEKYAADGKKTARTR